VKRDSPNVKSKSRSEERGSDKVTISRPRSRERERGANRTKNESRNSRSKPRFNRGNTPPHRHANNSRGERNSRFERIRVKEEPVSDDESRGRPRRDRHDRVAVKTEAGSGFGASTSGAPEPPKDKPNFGLSGKLAEDTNVYNGVVIKYSEPTEARKPNKKWRLYPFKGQEPLPMLPIHRQSAFLLGRERRAADIPIDHPSCSKQHAVFQFRVVPYQREDGRTGRRIRPYIIDLESANGTFVNNNKIDPKRYVELFEKDVLKFGFSSREYVLLHEGSSADDAFDEVPEESAEGETTEAAQS